MTLETLETLTNSRRLEEESLDKITQKHCFEGFFPHKFTGSYCLIFSFHTASASRKDAEGCPPFGTIPVFSLWTTCPGPLIN